MTRAARWRRWKIGAAGALLEGSSEVVGFANRLVGFARGDGE